MAGDFLLIDVSCFQNKKGYILYTPKWRIIKEWKIFMKIGCFGGTRGTPIFGKTPM